MNGIDHLPLRDNASIYQYDDPDSMVTIYATVRKGNATEGTNFTWEEVNAFNKWILGSASANLTVGKAEALIQFGDETGPLPGEPGYGEVISNATIQIRGASSSAMPQKSYKIELNKNTDKWRGQSTIALNKHIFDKTRLRNKLNFDLMKQIPNLLSLRTQFVHLYVKDETKNPPEVTFTDYGLFTQIEQPNRDFLENHLLDRNAQLYKATSFEFFRYEDQIRMVDDPAYDVDAFSRRLEIKGNADHSKLIQMLEDVNNYNLPIEQTFEKYFDADNYFTWMAYNILVGNVDTQNQNFFLYSPLNSNKWYFLPWDYDGSLDRLRRQDFEFSYQYWERGITNYWGSVLHNRVLRSEGYRNMLHDKIQELMGFLTEERLGLMVATYRPVVELFAFRPPDNTYLLETQEDFDRYCKLIPAEIENNYELYLESLDYPMPFFLGTPVISEDVLRFNWDEAYDFEGSDITYHFEVSKDFNFKTVIDEKSLVNFTTAETERFEPGVYFWRVTATNEAGKVQQAFDLIFDENLNPHDGLKSFTITPEGQVVE
jgi:spore coat protein H